MRLQDTIANDCSHVHPREAGAFESQGISGVSLVCGTDVLGICMACRHPALGLVYDKDVLLTMDGPDAFAPDQRYTRVRWRVPITPAGRRRWRNHGSEQKIVLRRHQLAEVRVVGIELPTSP